MVSLPKCLGVEWSVLIFATDFELTLNCIRNGFIDGWDRCGVGTGHIQTKVNNCRIPVGI